MSPSTEQSAPIRIGYCLSLTGPVADNSRSARLAHEACVQWTAGERWARLAAAGARPQRLLWASTSSKDPAYGDTRYVEALVAPGTVSTMPRATLDAYRDHGRPA